MATKAQIDIVGNDLTQSAFKSVINNIEQTNNSVTKLERSLQSGFSNLKSTLGFGLAGLFSVSTVKSIADASIQLDRVFSALTVGTGSVRDATKSFEFLKTVTSQLGIDLKTSSEQYSRLAAAARGTALEGKATQDLFVAVAQAAGALGLSSDDTGRALLALQQIVSKGKVSLEELSGQLGEVIPGAMQMAARAMGLTVGELNKMISSGQIMAHQLLPALASEITKTFGDQAIANSQGLNAQLNRLNNAMFDLKIAIAETGLIEFLTTTVKWGTQAANVLASVFGGGAKVSEIDSQVKKIDDLTNKLNSLRDKKNIPIFGEKILFNKKEEDFLLYQIETAKEELDKLKQSAKETKQATQEVITPPKTGGGTGGGKPTGGKSRKPEISESEKFIAQLKQEAEQAGLTKLELTKLQAAKLGLSEQSKEYIAHLEALHDKQIEETEGARIWNEELKKSQQVIESLKTPLDKLQDELTELKRLHDNGLLSFEQWKQAATNATVEWSKLGKGTKDTLRDSNQYVVQAARNMQTAFADFLFNPFDKGLKGLVKSLGSTLYRMAAEIASSKLLGGFENLFKGKSSSGSGGFFNQLSSIFSTGSTLSNFIPGSSSIGAFISGMGGGTVPGVSSQAALMGTQFATVAGPLLANAIGFYLGKEIGGDKKLFGMNSTITSAIGTVLGGPLGGIIGGSLNALFGRGPYKLNARNFIGEVDADSVDATIRDKFKSKGGLFTSNKSKFISTEIDQELKELLDNTLLGFSNSIRTFTKELQIDASALDAFREGFNIRIDHNDQEKAQQQITELFNSFGESMTRLVLPSVEQFNKSGESLFQTFQRLTGEFITLVDATVILGKSLQEGRDLVKNAGFGFQETFLKLFGGIENFSNLANHFESEFLDASVRAARDQEKLTEELNRLGLNAKMTRQEFTALVQSYGNANGISQELFAELLVLAPLFDKVHDSIESVNESTEGLTDGFAQAVKNIDDLKNDLQQAYDSRSSSLTAIRDSFKQIINNLSQFRQSLGQGALSPLTPAQKLDEARIAFNRAVLGMRSGDQKAFEELPRVAEEFLKASQVYNASSATYVSDFNLVRKILEEAEGYAQEQVDYADEQLKVLKEQVSGLLDVNDSVKSVEDAIRDLIEVMAATTGNQNITNEQIKAVANDPNLSNSQKLDWAKSKGVSDSQIISAVPGVTQKDLTNIRSGSYISDSQIREFVNANSGNLMAVYDAAVSNGISRQRLAYAMGWSVQEIEDWVRKNNLAMFKSGTDFVPKDGIAMLHKGEAVIPESVSGLIKELIQEVKELRREQNRQTDASIRTTVQSNIDNAERIINSTMQSVKNQVWVNTRYKIAGGR
ncbi:tape measure domain-containing protein [Nitrosomonas nitrosa]|uniref:tape measure protein n=1 Tax=Nitrosomonas nitrosa TaxID=52442 RepID=UPI000D317D40|nr:tape measure protein [Nitrosomonas nitrosa]PTR04970.1 tape measure domain-containing protein [Nitrosomonas nitrosa]